MSSRRMFLQCNVFVTVDKHCGRSSEKAHRMDLSHMKYILPTDAFKLDI